MNKNKIETIIKSGQCLSAQEYLNLTSQEKEALAESLAKDKQDPDEYEKKTKRLFPKKFTPKPFSWRKIWQS